MGVDLDHTSYDRLAQGIPPAYAQWVFSQMCMQMAHVEFGCPIFTFDMMKENPALARRTLASWLLGAGADRPSAGMALVPQVAHLAQQKGAGVSSVHGVPYTGASVCSPEVDCSGSREDCVALGDVPPERPSEE